MASLALAANISWTLCNVGLVWHYAEIYHAHEYYFIYTAWLFTVRPSMKQRWNYAAGHYRRMTHPSKAQWWFQHARAVCAVSLIMPAVTVPEMISSTRLRASGDSSRPGPAQVRGHGRFLIPTRVTSLVVIPELLPVSSPSASDWTWRPILFTGAHDGRTISLWDV